MRGRTLLTGMLVMMAVAGAAWARDPIDGEVWTDSETEIVLELADAEVQPMVDCSDQRPDDDCLSGRLGADQVMQACNGIGPLFGAGSCSTHCQVGYYACGRCGFGGFAACTCRENFSCDPYRP
ncbi:MAG TPA: hypothetical protein VFV75_10450 [Candidatus Polarisedimenticolaceae bacterium]|nr:hypothetical protein [Candidatus Polarisedimenticolaceae bacterium]